jgi:cytochrome P450/NADPH-cytochrome P450 reductase
MLTKQYSISSSALDDPRLVTLTVTILDAPHMSQHGRYVGTATTYLASLQPGMQVRATTRPSNESFHPPLDPTVPMVLIGAGSGIAPFRAFIQERALQK